MKKALIIGIVLMIVLMASSVIAAKPTPAYCGDGICNGAETCSTCPGDCGACPPPTGDYYAGLPFKALKSCIDACGTRPDQYDLEANYAYELCMGQCHPMFYAVTDYFGADSFFDVFTYLQDAIENIELTPGPQGEEGLSAYEVALANGFIGTEAEWLASLIGPEGPTGPQGPEGPQGPQGPAGQDGSDGAPGADGEDGIHCWDLNGNGVCDTETEDKDADHNCNVQDCVGPQGPPGVTVETDPVFTASAAADIDATDITNWNMAYGWGDHATQGYLNTEDDPQVGALTNDYWCISDGVRVNCNQPKPVTSESDPTVPDSIKDGIDWSELSGVPLDIADGDQDTILTEAEVDAMVANNGYLLKTGDTATGNYNFDGGTLRIDSANHRVEIGTNQQVGSSGGLVVQGPVNLGRDNQVDSNSFSVAMGENSKALGDDSIAMGVAAQANGFSSIAMGHNTAANGFSSTAMGSGTTAAGDFSLAAGSGASANHPGTFVWADYIVPGADFASTGSNQFLIRASGGVGIGKNNPAYQLDVNGKANANELCINGNCRSAWPVDTDTTLTEEQVDAMVSDNGYLTGYTEIDPLFTGWDKHTGISITESQISDLKAYLTAETDPQVADTTSGKWCVGTGNAVTCDQDAPTSCNCVEDIHFLQTQIDELRLRIAALEAASNPEICDGIDNNLNGQTDEGDPLVLCPPTANVLTSACAAGVCIVANGGCSSGWDDCNRNFNDGCEINLLTDPNHCGGCINVCDAGVNCIGGVCGVCSSGQTRSCYTGPAGTEGRGVCQPGMETCESGAWGACVGEALPTAETCDGRDNDCDGTSDEDFNLWTDVNNCGSCGHVCNDLNPATEDVCNNGVCESILVVCDDGVACTIDTFDAGNCISTPDHGFCDDGNVCTDDVCNVNSGCINFPTADGTSCDDGNLCTQADICAVGMCAGIPVADGTSCTLYDMSPGQCMAGVCVAGCTPTTEVCDGIDNNCDGVVDNDIPPDYCSVAGGVGLCSGGTSNCVDGSWVCTPNQPRAEECNGLDDDCNGVNDNGILGTGEACYALSCAQIKQDNPAAPSGMYWIDPDGGGLSGPMQLYCDMSADSDNDGYTTTGGDCNDADATVHPGATELCDGLDNDCNSVILATEVDNDGDGYVECTIDAGGWDGVPSKLGGDCNDTKASVYPGAPETCNGIDDNCDGIDDYNYPIGQICGSGAFCSGASGCMCNSWMANCNNNWADGCEITTYSNVDNCGSCGAACSTNHITRSCSVGNCVGTCNLGYADCNGNKRSDGCEVSTQTDVNNCGNCGAACHLANAYQACTSGACRITSCYSGYYDLNTLPGDGCECSDDTYEYNDVCSSPRHLGTLSDIGQVVTLGGKISSSSDVDYYLFNAYDNSDIIYPDKFYVRVRFLTNPGNEFEFKVYKGAVCGSLVYTGTDYSLDGTYLIDDSDYFYVQVYRKSGATPTCGMYELEMSNGLYG